MADLIYDRAKADVDRAIMLDGKMARGTASEAERAEWMAGAKGAINVADLNRIETATRTLAELLLGYGYRVSVDVRDGVHGVQELTFTGAEQVFTAPADGAYTLTAAGAEGSAGNCFGTAFGSVGGKGARLTASFPLAAGDVLHIVVGGRGTGSTGAARDGASGGGGGGTFVFREISAITDARWQFAKAGKNYEVLLVAAGGGGAHDEGYRKTRGDGCGGIGAAYQSPANFVARGTQTNPGTASTSISACMGIAQYISYGLVGAFYARGTSTGRGGFGGGSATDDNRGYGGGWYGANYTAYSWALGDAVGEDGANSGDGMCRIAYEGLPWMRTDLPNHAEIDRIRRNIDALQKGFYSLPDWREIVYHNRLGFEQANAMEWDLHTLGAWLNRMVAAFCYAGEVYGGEI